MASPQFHRALADLRLPTEIEAAVRELVNATDARDAGAPAYVDLHLDRAAAHLRNFENQAKG